MLDPKLIQDSPELIRENLKKRGASDTAVVDDLQKLLEEKKELQQQAESLREERNRKSKEIGKIKQAGGDIEKVSEEVREIGNRIKELETQLADKDEKFMDLNLGLPNILDSKVPLGKSEADNVTVQEASELPKYSFKPLTHYELAEKNGWIDFERGVKLAGARYYTYFDRGAKLERALANFMLDLHTTENGYTEVWVPQLVNDDSMRTTGQYPKFQDEYYRLDKDNLNLIPTAEVPLTNLFRDEILPESDLPVCVTAHTSCFRREAGSYGKDTRGIIRVHQFQKVELVKICHPDESEKEHEKMLENAKKVLTLLGLPFRVLLLCSADTSASSSITYDLEVWMPGMNRFLEISSVSNFKDYQARRGKIRYKSKEGKNILAHTINGSGLAIGRTLAAVMENYQDVDGNIHIPQILQKYFQ